MIWQNPWAWVGLLTLGLPILVHLLARRAARVQRFPSLRFLDEARPVATRRSRLSDLPLLAVRCAVLFVATVALAAPYVLSADRTARLAGTVARVIVVDTSASMLRATPAGEGARDVARREALAAAADAGVASLIETVAPGAALGGAAAWLDARAGLREIVVISDFQRGTLDPADRDAVPPTTGLEMRRVDVIPDAVTERVTRHGGSETVARVTAADDGLRVEWSRRSAGDAAGPTAGAAAGDALALMAGPDERERADAALEAALADGAAPDIDAARPLAILFGGYPDRAAVLAGAGPLDEPWMADAVALMRDDPVLAAAAADAEIIAALPPDADRAAGFIGLARTRDGRPVAAAARARVAGANRLVVTVLADAGSLASAAAIRAAGRAVAVGPPARELEPAMLTDAELADWSRPATAAPASAGVPRGESDGRWLWLVVLLLLLVEGWLRRERVAARGAAQPAAGGGSDGEPDMGSAA
jgi:hypothetical protein